MERNIKPVLGDNEAQLIVTSLTSNYENQALGYIQNNYDAHVINTSSAALTVSSFPWDPIAAIKVAKINDDYVINPTSSQKAQAQSELLYVGTKDKKIISLDFFGTQVEPETFYQSIKIAQEKVIH